MKKTIFILIAILIGAYLILALLSLSNVEYPAERLFYRAMKINSSIALNPDVAPPQLVKAIEDNLQKLLKKYPEAKVAKQAHTALAEFYIVNKNYGSALSETDAIMKSYGNDAVMMSTAHFLKGLVHEKENQWNKALEEFSILRNKYPNTKLGIQVPLYIGRYYAAKGETSQAEAAYRDAALFYKKLEEEHGGSVLGYAASTFLINAYLALKDYRQAGAAVEYTLSKYPSQQTHRHVLPYVELIYLKKLNYFEKARAIYNDLKSKSRDERLVKFLQKKLDELETEKPNS